MIESFIMTKSQMKILERLHRKFDVLWYQKHI